MQLSERDILRRLGCGESIAAVCAAAGLERAQFDAWWRETMAARVPSPQGTLRADVARPVEVRRDRWGVPHIFAENDADLFFAFGLTMAQDRLFQLDYLRRKGTGRLAEVLGAEALPLDTIARTVGLHRIAAARCEKLDAELRAVLAAFAAGVNRVIEEAAENPPIEFDLLDYRPEPWTPLDCLAIETEFQWYLTGRLPVIAIPELAKRTLGEGPLYEDFLLGECDDEAILHAGEYEPAAGPQACEPVGHVLNDPGAATGSNNWVLAGARTTTGQPLLASDPHIALEAVSCWYQVHLCGGSFHVAGMTYVGIPAVMFGRNQRLAWGITNNICSQRDLYQERTEPAHPDCFLYDGGWEPQRSLTETIGVRDGEPVRKTIRFSRNGPLVDELLPPGAEQTGPVSLKWLGAYQDGWLRALLDMDRAGDVEQFRAALRPWHVPTFSLVIADVDGNIGFQAGGRIPVRKQLERAYRPGWDPQHQWQGLIPFERMPSVVNPPRGWIASANNRLAADDYPYRLFGCWSSGWRARRIREMIEAREQLTPQDMQLMQQDALSLRALKLVPHLLAAIEQRQDERTRAAARLLRDWDGRCHVDSPAAAIFNVFFTHWCQTVARQRFAAEAVELVAGSIAGCAGRLLAGDPQGWFAGQDPRRLLAAALDETLALLSERCGPDPGQWSWGQLHRMPLKHVLSCRGELGELLDHGGHGVRGDMVTVCNSGSGPQWIAATGAGYRLVADLSRQPPVLQAVDAQSQSGHPGSRHYGDQLETWLAGDYHEIPLDRAAAKEAAVTQLVLQPGSGDS